MSTDPVAALLEKLSTGDPAAAEQAFLAYEPYLRMVVRRQLPSWLRPKFDSVDVVQSVWADLLDGFRSSGYRFTDANHLRAFLITVTQHRFVDRLRQHERARDHEERLYQSHEAEGAVAPDPRPSQVAQAEELFEQMLALCPEGHREMLRLKRQGLALDEIARRTGLHPSSVRRILYDLARRLAARQEDGTRSSSAEP
jgi:RNA polymerase sigma-70 factor (ECF subfamily)